MSELIRIGNQEIMAKEYNGQRVITFKDIDTVHERTDGTARKRFNDNKKHFVDGVDYFKVKCSEVRPFFGQTLPNGFNPDGDLVLVTESGYMMLVKSFTDDIAWKVQRELVNTYFRARKPLSQLEILQESLNILKNHSDRLDTMDTQISGIETKITDLEFDVPLYSCEAKELSDHVKRKGVEVLGGKNSNAYKNKSLRAKVYQDIYGVIKREFGLYGEDGKFQSYLSLTRRYKEAAHKLVDKYEVPTFLYELICNENNVVAA